jgi:hypothetical protein
MTAPHCLLRSAAWLPLPLSAAGLHARISSTPAKLRLAVDGKNARANEDRFDLDQKQHSLCEEGNGAGPGRYLDQSGLGRQNDDIGPIVPVARAAAHGSRLRRLVDLMRLDSICLKSSDEAKPPSSNQRQRLLQIGDQHFGFFETDG